MPLAPLVGHEKQRQLISAAINSGRLPQLLLFTGQDGIGKQRLGLWVAQRLLCEEPDSEPCGRCRQCRLVLALAHPDVHWFMPVPRPKAGEADKQVEELETTIGEILEERRKDPAYRSPDGLSGHFVATARLINRRALMRPVEGRARVFLIGHAERLVPQESSPEAANALLKLLEEPTEGSYFLMTAVDAEGVLPTIRSRAVRLSLGNLTDEQIREFLSTWKPALSGGGLDQLVARANGSIGRALADDPDDEKATEAAATLLQAARSRNAAGWEMAIKQTPFSARGEFTETLDAMAALLVAATREDAGPSSGGELSTVPRERLVAAIDKVEEARELAQNNVNPQLLLAVLNQELSEIL